MEKYMRKRDRADFNDFTRKEQVLQYMEERHGIRPESIPIVENWECTFDETKYRDRLREIDKQAQRKCVSEYNAENSRGKFFQSKLDGGSDGADSGASDSESDLMNTGSLFDED